MLKKFACLYFLSEGCSGRVVERLTRDPGVASGTVLHAQIQKVLSEGVQIFFLVDEGIEDQDTTINWPSSARQQNAI